MSLVLTLPDVLIEIIFTEWIDWYDFLQFDSSLCNKHNRLQFLSFLSNFHRGNVLYLALPSHNLALQRRNGCSAFHDIVDYCAKRKVQFLDLTISETDEIITTTKDPKAMATFCAGVKELKILFETAPVTDTLYFIGKLNSFRCFSAIQKLEIKCKYDFMIQFDLLFDMLGNSWSNLKHFHINVPSGKFSNYDRSRVLSADTTRIKKEENENVARTGTDMNHSLDTTTIQSIFSRLVQLDLSNIHLDVIYVYKIFLEIGLPSVQTVELSSKPANWSSKYGGTRFNPYSKIHLLSNVTEKGKDGNHPGLMVFDGEDSSDEDEYQEIHGGSVSNPIRIRVYMRPRKSICMERSRIRDFDDFCQLFEQSAQNSSIPYFLLNHLRKISGNYLYVYPLLPLMGASLSSLSLTLHPSQNDFEARTSEADSISGKIFHNLSGLMHLCVHIEGDMSHPLNKWNFSSILIGSMLSLQSITITLCGGSIKNMSRYLLPSWIETMSSITRRIYFPELFKIEFKPNVIDTESFLDRDDSSIASVCNFVCHMREIAPLLREFMWNDDNIIDSFPSHLQK